MKSKIGMTGTAAVNDVNPHAPTNGHDRANATRRDRIWISVVTIAPAALLCIAAEASPDLEDNLSSPRALKRLSVEELMQIEVTSVSKRAESLFDAPASIYVITAEDIRRSGATSIPQILRLAPNLQVARLDADEYAISARGGLAPSANKLLVLMDGRTLYTPLFSGVFWDVQDTFLPDIERIEVISGPGGTLWGSNAVNGVINIITRRASETQGAMIVGGAGNDERGASLRYGGSGSHGSYRLYGQFHEWDHTDRPDGSNVGDAWDKGQVGFRTDWTAGSNDSFTLQGDAYDGDILSGNANISGANLLARWNRQLEAGDYLQLQAYYDYTHRDVPPVFGEDLSVFDVEFQHFLRPMPGQAITWGAGYRRGDDAVDNSAFLAFLPADRDLDWGNAFLQDEIALIEERLHLTLGAKADYNPYTEFEFLPAIRVAWKVASEHLLWASLSRAVRAPSRIDRELFAPGNPPFLLQGGPHFRSEVFHVGEIGYRGSPTPNTSVSITIFRSNDEKIRSIALVPGGAEVQNALEGKTTGVEAWGTYQPAAFWTLSAGGTYMDKDLHVRAGFAVPPGTNTEGNDPDYEWVLRSSFDLPHRVELDLFLRGMGQLPNPRVPAYTELNLRLAWDPIENVELSVVGANLLQDDHQEFVNRDANSEIERSFYMQFAGSF